MLYKCFYYYRFVSAAVRFYTERRQLEEGGDLTLRLRPSQGLKPASPLRFPGKISVNRAGDRLAVSDTGHHRVLLIDLQGVVQVGASSSKSVKKMG